MSQMLKSTSAMGAATFLSRLLGMVREMVYANFMGDGPIAGAFQMALTLPNLFRRLLGEGALTAAFIPIFKDKERNEGEREMWQAANAVISGLFIAATVIIALVVLGISLVLAFAEPPSTGMSSGALSSMPQLAVPEEVAKGMRPETRLMLELTRIMFPYMLLVCLAAVLMGMLNARGHFFVPALGAAILNLVLIGVVMFIAPHTGKTLATRIYAVAYGLLFAGTAQALYQLPALYGDGFRLKWVSPFENPTVKRVAHQMLPGMMGVAAFQINVVVTQGLAFWEEAGIVASFNYAVRLMEFPQGIFAISLATFLLPTLSGMAAEKNWGEFRATYKQAVGYLYFVNLLASVLLFVLAEPMIRLIFEHGQFNALSTKRSAEALRFLGPGLLAFSMVNITARAFYAMGDTRTPMKISTVCLLLNVVFAFLLIPPLKQGGMALANTLSACFNVYLLSFGLRKKLSKLDFAELWPNLIRMFILALGAGLLAWGLNYVWEARLGHATLFARFGAVFVPVGAAALLYVGALVLLKTPQAVEATAFLRKRLQKKSEATTL